MPEEQQNDVDEDPNSLDKDYESSNRTLIPIQHDAELFRYANMTRATPNANQFSGSKIDGSMLT